MKLSIGQKTDPGPRQGPNQDSIRVIQSEAHPQSTLLVVADGMGGAAAGDYASSRAVEVIGASYFEDAPPAEKEVAARLESAIFEANDAIFDKASQSQEHEGMGSTVVSMAIHRDMFWIASVGDSRAYRIRGREIEQLTTDHTWVNARVREGLLSPEQAINHALGHVLERAIGVERDVEVDIAYDDRLVDGDTFVLCSDGLYGVVDDGFIAWAAANHSAQEAADLLIQHALEAPAHDNVSVIVLQAGMFDPAQRWSLSD